MTSGEPQPHIWMIKDVDILPSEVFDFAVVEKSAIKCSSVLQAVDLTFKMFYILDLHYTTKCSTVWQFLQCIVYAMDEGKSATPLMKSLRSYFMPGTYSAC